MAKQALSIIKKIFLACCLSLTIITGAVYLYAGKLLLGKTSVPYTISLPPFYKQILNEEGAFSIIEYPVIIQDRFNPLYQYQSVHGKKILHGYFQSHALKKEWQVPEVIKNNVLLAEVIFSRLESKKLNLSGITGLLPGFIDLYDIPSLKRSGAKYIVLHKNIKDEIIALKNDPELTNEITKGNNDKRIWQHSTRSALHLKSYYSRYFGKPVYEDDMLIALKIN